MNIPKLSTTLQIVFSVVLLSILKKKKIEVKGFKIVK